MKRILLAMLLMFSLTDYAQTYTNDDKSLTGVFEVQNKTKAEIFSAINKWISINYNSGKSVTQLSDAGGGNIVVKGINEVNYTNSYKTISNSKYVQPTISTKLNHLIDISVKDNRFRIVYRITYFVPTSISVNSIMTTNPLELAAFGCINLNGPTDVSIEFYNKVYEPYLKMGSVGKTKRELFFTQTKPMFDECNANLIVDIKKTMLSIQSAVTSPTKDGW